MMYLKVKMTIESYFSSIHKCGFRAKNLKIKEPNLLILEHLKNYFIEALNKFLCALKLMG